MSDLSEIGGEPDLEGDQFDEDDPGAGLDAGAEERLLRYEQAHDYDDDEFDDDDVNPEEQLLLDRTELSEAGLELDDPAGFADE
jgi:hypothetical protein